MEYNYVIVPLDGSELAETVIPHLELLFIACKIKGIELVQVIHSADIHYKSVVPYSVQEEHKIVESAVAEAEKYLKEIKTRIRVDPNKVITTVLKGNVASVLQDHINKGGADLLLMATHGRSGISRLYWGSTAEKLIHSVYIPILIVPPPLHKPK
jgi:nucleotide-binding universal stress UspA family protein